MGKYRHEFSAGGVVFRRHEGRWQFLLGKHSGYHKWVLPKGLVEKGEEPEVAAIRETEEELGVKTKLAQSEPINQFVFYYTADYKQKDDGSTRRVRQYQEEGGDSVRVKKTARFYLLEYSSGDPQDHGWEMSQVEWVDEDEVLSRLDFAQEKRTVQLALDQLNSVNKDGL